MYIITYTMTPSVCESCPLTEPLSLLELFPEDIHWKVRQIIDEVHDWEEKRIFLIRALSMGIFQWKPYGEEALWTVAWHISSVWNLWDRGVWDCSQHHLQRTYTELHGQSFCVRRYMLEETMKHFSELWNESSYNEQKFLELSRDRILAF